MIEDGIQKALDRTGVRGIVLSTGMIALLGGLWAGLLRLGWAGPQLRAGLPAVHGPLMVGGFLGTVISLERAVALDRAWAFLAPACTGVGGLLTLTGTGGAAGPLLVMGGSLGLVAIFGSVLLIQAAPFVFVMGGGAVAWTVGNGLWLAGWPVHALVPWWIGFLVLTIAGERLELSRMLFHASWTKRLFLSFVGVLGVGLVLSVSAPDLGVRVMGAGLTAVALWLAVYDVARRTVQADGLPRFIAVCLLAGYAWLGVGGGLTLAYGDANAGYVYDATLHAVLVGFVFSMIFGHAPIVFPSVLGLSVSYRPVFYVHVVVLHASLLLRVGGDLASVEPLRGAGGWGNAAAILLFLGTTAHSILTTPNEDRTGPEPHLDGAAAPGREKRAAGAEDVPDLQLEAD